MHLLATFAKGWQPWATLNSGLNRFQKTLSACCRQGPAEAVIGRGSALQAISVCVCVCVALLVSFEWWGMTAILVWSCLDKLPALIFWKAMSTICQWLLQTGWHAEYHTCALFAQGGNMTLSILSFERTSLMLKCCWSLVGAVVPRIVYLQKRNVRWVLENPTSSLLWRYKCIRDTWWQIMLLAFMVRSIAV